MHMNHYIRTFLFIVVLFAGALNAYAFRWEQSITTALKKSKQLKKPVLLVFSNPKADVKSKSFETKLLGSHDFKAYTGKNLVAVKFDMGKPMNAKTKQVVKKIIAHYGVKKYPTVILLDSNKKKLGTVRIGEDPEEFLTMLKSIASRYKPIEKKAAPTKKQVAAR